MPVLDPSIIDNRARMLGSFSLFTKVFYELRTGRKFNVPIPIGRESHINIICEALTRVFNGEITRLIINIPPRYGKTELIINWISWCLARYPDSNFIYISYSHALAKKQTRTIKQIVEMREYQKYFGIELSKDTSAGDNFELSAGGSVYASGTSGTVTGRGAGIKNCDRFGGALVVDDYHKPSEATSDVIRKKNNEDFKNTLVNRINSVPTPIVYIGQVVHEDDISQNLKNGFTGDKYEVISLAALDGSLNALDPTMHTKEKLLIMQETMPYEFAAQYQQKPTPAGGAIFKRSWFKLTDIEPEILATFITADTAETEKNYNDATSFNFWGVYKIKHLNIDTGLLGLHWIDCEEFRIDPMELEGRFNQFYFNCLRHRIKPKIAAIEKKSTGVTLISTMKKLQGLQIIELIPKDSKTSRFLGAQPYISQGQLSINDDAQHKELVLSHMEKITANKTHRFDDIADNAAYAVKLALIDKSIYREEMVDTKRDAMLERINNEFVRRQNVIRRARNG